MTNLKAIFLLCLAFLSQAVFAGEWNHIQTNIEGHRLQISYTKRFVTPTYGTNGGSMTGKLFVDLYSPRAARVQRVEILESFQGRVSTVTTAQVQEDGQQHHWAQLDKGGYAGTLSIGKTYLLRMDVDGRVLQVTFKLN